MKVGIITMISDNYGNRLQNYALQQSIKKGLRSKHFIIHFCMNIPNGNIF